MVNKRDKQDQAQDKTGGTVPEVDYQSRNIPEEDIPAPEILTADASSPEQAPPPGAVSTGAPPVQSEGENQPNLEDLIKEKDEKIKEYQEKIKSLTEEKTELIEKNYQEQQQRVTTPNSDTLKNITALLRAEGLAGAGAKDYKLRKLMNEVRALKAEKAKKK
jgi:hypothetical protein